MIPSPTIGTLNSGIGGTPTMLGASDTAGPPFPSAANALAGSVNGRNRMGRPCENRRSSEAPQDLPTANDEVHTDLA